LIVKLQTECGYQFTSNLEAQKHELKVSRYQMCVLMLFNNADRLSCKEIEQATAIPMPDLKRCLQSLALVKGKNVLRKEPMSKDIAEDDAFFFNDKFTSKLFKVKIGTVVAQTQRESEPENIETRQRVEEDRKPQIEAAIVRVMKSTAILLEPFVILSVISLLLLKKLSVALTKTDKSNVVKSRSSFLGLVFQIVQQNFFATPI
jgi:cullin 3